MLGGAIVAAAIAIMNVTTYGLTIVMARWLGPGQFGQFSSILGVLIVVNVVSLGLQTTGARRVARSPEDRHQIEDSVLRASRRAAVGVTVICLLAVPLITRVLRLDSWLSAALMAVSAGFLCLMGGQVGILQGERRWGSVSSVYIAMGVARLILGCAALLVDRSTLGAMFGVALGAAVPAVVGWFALRRPVRGAPEPPVGAEPESTWSTWEGGSIAREVAHSAHVLLAFFAVSNIDVVVARATLDDHRAGLYAAGLVLTKAVLFLPQFVVIVAFPALARSRGGPRTHLLGLGVVLAMGASATAVVSVLSGPALGFVGGPSYSEVQDRLWVFAALGSVLSLIQLLVYSALAQEHQRSVWLIWGALVVMTTGFVGVHSVNGLLSLKLAVDLTLLVALATFVLLGAAKAQELEVAKLAPPLAEDFTSPEQPAIR